MKTGTKWIIAIVVIAATLVVTALILLIVFFIINRSTNGSFGQKLLSAPKKLMNKAKKGRQQQTKNTQ